MTDRDLLEAAARAAGIEILGFDPDGRYAVTESEGLWNPLRRDGDALRLAVKLGLEVSISKLSGTVYACRFGCLPGAETEECNPSDPYAAARRAIVRAAAAMDGSKR